MVSGVEDRMGILVIVLIRDLGPGWPGAGLVLTLTHPATW